MNYIYCRISTDKQSEASLDNQEATCREWVSEPITVIHEIESGAKSDRPKLNEMINQLRTGDTVCVYDYSRLSRKVKDALDFLDMISDRGATLISGGKTIDPDEPLDMFTYSVHSAFSEMQRTLQAKKAKKGQEKVFESGDWVFCSTLFGYSLARVGKTKIVSVIEEEAKIIRFIFEKYSSGWSIKKLLSELQGLPLSRQSNFTLKKISRILQNPIYMGYYTQPNVSVPSKSTRNELESLLIKSNMYTPLVEEEVWWECFDKYRTNTPTHSRPWTLRWTKHTLSGIIRCPDCGKGISRFEHTHCYTTEDHSPDCQSKCRAKYDETWLERIMEICFYVTFMSGDEIGQFFSEKQQELFASEHELVQAIADISKAYYSTQSRIDRIVAAISLGIITNEQASKQMASLKEEQSQLEDRKKLLEQDLRSVETDIDSYIELSSEEIIDNFYNNKRDYYKKFISYSYLYNDRIEVEYLNGKHFVIPRGFRHNHKVDPVTVTVSYNDNEYPYNNDEYSFVYELNKIVYNPCGVKEYDDFVKSLLDKSWSLVTEST